MQDFIYASYIMELRAVVTLIPVGEEGVNYSNN